MYELFLTLYVKDPLRGKEIVLERFLNRLIHAHNCTRHETTGFSPFSPDFFAILCDYQSTCCSTLAATFNKVITRIM